MTATVHVLTNKAHLQAARLPGVVAVVLDVVFATTGIAIALERGATEIVPALNPQAALAYAGKLPAGSFVLAGELDARPIPGFVEPWPHRLLQQDFTGKSLVYSSTNGTVALNLAAGAGLVLAAALVNAAAVVAYVLEEHAGRDIVLVCAGSGDEFTLEDFYGAGYLVSLLARAAADLTFTDAAKAAWLLHDRTGPADCLLDARAGRLMREHGLEQDVSFCGRKNLFTAVPVLREGRISRG